MAASIYRSLRGETEILWLYDEALSHLRIGYESKTVSTRYGETHVHSLGLEDAPPVVFLHGGTFLNPTCLRWFFPIAQRHRIHSPDIVGQPGKSVHRHHRAGLRVAPGAPRLIGTWGGLMPFDTTSDTTESATPGNDEQPPAKKSA